MNVDEGEGNDEEKEENQEGGRQERHNDNSKVVRVLGKRLEREGVLVEDVGVGREGAGCEVLELGFRAVPRHAPIP